MNFNLTQVETSTLPELLNMLKTAEDSIRKEKGYVLMVEPSKERKFKSGPKKTINVRPEKFPISGKRAKS